MAALAERLCIPVEDGVTSIFQLDRKPFSVDDDLQARRQPDQVIGIGKRIRLIEIVHAPAKPAFGIPPCSKTIDVQIANRKNLRSTAMIGAYRWPQLSPSVEGPSEKTKRRLPHLLVL